MGSDLAFRISHIRETMKILGAPRSKCLVRVFGQREDHFHGWWHLDVINENFYFFNSWYKFQIFENEWMWWYLMLLNCFIFVVPGWLLCVVAAWYGILFFIVILMIYFEHWNAFWFVCSFRLVGREWKSWGNVVCFEKASFQVCMCISIKIIRMIESTKVLPDS